MPKWGVFDLVGAFDGPMLALTLGAVECASEGTDEVTLLAFALLGCLDFVTASAFDGTLLSFTPSTKEVGTTGQNMKNTMTLDAAQAAKVKAEEQANDQMGFATAPTSTRKRTLREINPLACDLLVQANIFCDSATKRRRTEEADTDIGYRSQKVRKLGSLCTKLLTKKVIMMLLAFLLPSQELGFPRITLIRRGVSAKKSVKRSSSLSFFSISKDCNDRIQGNAIQHRN